LPEAYRQLRGARRLSAQAAKELDELSAEVARPPAAWKKVAIVVGYAVGGVTLFVLAIGAIVGVIAGIIGAAKADAGDAIGAIIVGICTLVCGLVSVPLVGELLVFTYQHGGFDAAQRLVLTEATNFDIDLYVGGVLYLFAVVPIALAYTTSVKLKGLTELRAELTATTLKAGVAGCRSCGAPLDVAEGAIATRCIYCGTESLVNVGNKVAAKARGKAQKLHGSVQEAIAQLTAAREDDRKTMWAMLLLGPLLLPFVALGGFFLHLLTSA
jgi:hypothetical protein